MRENVVIEVIVRHEANVSAGEAGNRRATGTGWLFSPGKDFTRSESGNAKVQASPDTSAE
jgi:hypothetical protein